jgi:hypothetical protein
MSLKVIKQLSLKRTQPYGNVYRIDLRKVEVLGVCEYIEVFFIDFPCMSVFMEILVLDLLDSCGILLSRT